MRWIRPDMLLICHVVHWKVLNSEPTLLIWLMNHFQELLYPGNTRSQAGIQTGWDTGPSQRTMHTHIQTLIQTLGQFRVPSPHTGMCLENQNALRKPMRTWQEHIKPHRPHSNLSSQSTPGPRDPGAMSTNKSSIHFKNTSWEKVLAFPLMVVVPIPFRLFILLKFSF